MSTRRRAVSTDRGAVSTEGARLQAAISRAEAGLPVDGRQLPPRARRAVAVAERLGAPRAPALRAVAAAARDHDELGRAVDVAAAEGRSVARGLVLAPPVLGPLTALLVTEDPFAVWSTTAGSLVLGLAVALWGLGSLAVRTLVSRATSGGRAGDDRGEEVLELVAVGLSAGLALPAAVREAGVVSGPSGAAQCTGAAALWFELGARGEPPAGWERTGPELAAAQREGVPLVELTRSLAATLRREAHHRALERAARLGARLTLPTTLLLLPAAVLVVAAPLLHGLLSALG